MMGWKKKLPKPRYILNIDCEIIVIELSFRKFLSICNCTTMYIFRFKSKLNLGFNIISRGKKFLNLATPLRNILRKSKKKTFGIILSQSVAKFALVHSTCCWLFGSLYLLLAVLPISDLLNVHMLYVDYIPHLF